MTTATPRSWQSWERCPVAKENRGPSLTSCMGSTRSGERGSRIGYSRKVGGSRIKIERVNKRLSSPSRGTRSTTPAIPEKFLQLLKENQEVREIWESNRPDLEDQSRSGFDASMASELVNRHYSYSEMLTILRQMPSGMGKRRWIEYFNFLISEARSERVQQFIKPTFTI